MLGELFMFLVELVIGVVYPLYMTLNTLEVTQTSKEPFINWTFYWIAFAVVQSLSWYLDWLNLFCAVKLCLLAFLVAPKLEGSKKLYEFCNQNLFKKLASLSETVKILVAEQMGRLE